MNDIETNLLFSLLSSLAIFIGKQKRSLVENHRNSNFMPSLHSYWFIPFHLITWLVCACDTQTDNSTRNQLLFKLVNFPVPCVSVCHFYRLWKQSQSAVGLLRNFCDVRCHCDHTSITLCVCVWRSPRSLRRCCAATYRWTISTSSRDLATRRPRSTKSFSEQTDD